jgi:nucleotide-binding universal stress UspA family protein
MYERILVPLDGSKLSEMVLPNVEALVEKFASTVILVRVNPPPSTSSATGLPPREPTSVHRLAQQAADGQLSGVAEQLRAKGCNVQLEGPNGSPADEILDAARASRVDLIAMTTHGLGGLGRLLMGSVADEILRKASCPVLLVRVDESMAHRAHLERVVF